MRVDVRSPPVSTTEDRAACRSASRRRTVLEPRRSRPPRRRSPIRFACEILDVLRSGPARRLPVRAATALRVSQPTLSHHLSKLRDAGLVEVERRGLWAYYSINDDALEVLRSWLS